MSMYISTYLYDMYIHNCTPTLFATCSIFQSAGPWVTPQCVVHPQPMEQSWWSWGELSRFWDQWFHMVQDRECDSHMGLWIWNHYGIWSLMWLWSCVIQLAYIGIPYRMIAWWLCRLHLALGKKSAAKQPLPKPIATASMGSVPAELLTCQHGWSEVPIKVKGPSLVVEGTSSGQTVLFRLAGLPLTHGMQLVSIASRKMPWPPTKHSITTYLFDAARTLIIWPGKGGLAMLLFRKATALRWAMLAMLSLAFASCKL